MCYILVGKLFGPRGYHGGSTTVHSYVGDAGVTDGVADLNISGQSHPAPGKS
jgi:hypothetical protein